MNKNNSSGSLPEIVEAIDRAYDLAFSLISRLRFAETFATQSAELTTVSVFEGEDEAERIAESIAQTKGKLFDRRSDLQDLCSLIDSDLEGLREAFVGVPIEVFGFSYAELGDFEEADDRSAYASLNSIAYAVRKWIGETIGFLSLAEQIPVNLDLSLRQKCNDLADGFPIDQNFERAIRKRLLFEKSILCRNAKAYAETRGIIGTETTTTPQGRKKSEKTKEQLGREKSFLDLLSEYEKWQDKQAKRSGPVDWLEDKAKWSSKSKAFFKERCGERDGTEAKIIKDSISFARKIWKQVSGD